MVSVMSMQMSRLEGNKILLGVTGGIAVYKSAVLCSNLVKAGVAVTVVMTENAQRFVCPLTFSTLTGNKVYSSLWDCAREYDVGHISLAEQSDLIVVAPATANIIAKMANGICDDLLSTVLCGAEGKILLAPAMNQRMWQNPATIRNIKTLKKQNNCQIVGPETGRLACGTEGIGRMAEPENILKQIIKLLKT